MFSVTPVNLTKALSIQTTHVQHKACGPNAVLKVCFYYRPLEWLSLTPQIRVNLVLRLRLRLCLWQEREEKVRLQTQIKRLWEDNQRLQEESRTSAAKLKKFTEWVFNTIDMN